MSTPQFFEGAKFCYQGATIVGLKPIVAEVDIWIFCAILRELVYAYPATGTVQEEFKIYIDTLYDEWQVQY